MCQSIPSFIRFVSLTLAFSLGASAVSGQTERRNRDPHFAPKLEWQTTEEDDAGLVLGVIGATLAVGGCVLLAIGLPATEDPRPGLPFDEELARQQSATGMSVVGGVGLALGAVFVVVALLLGEDDDSSAWSLDERGATLRF